MRQVIPTPGAPKPNGQYSPAVRSGNLLYIAGQLGQIPETGAFVKGGVEAETKQVFANLKAILNDAGLTFDNVIKCNSYVLDIANLPIVNKFYIEHFPENPPARTSLQVAAIPHGGLVEIELIAAFE
ncbi:MAG: Rid family detoxifying hydrolase [Oscillospiraceae bacterium]|nr:Rid family detoxifying hydrolase [Oscillospiraceae bacterium]